MCYVVIAFKKNLITEMKFKLTSATTTSSATATTWGKAKHKRSGSN